MSEETNKIIDIFLWIEYSETFSTFRQIETSIQIMDATTIRLIGYLFVCIPIPTIHN